MKLPGMRRKALWLAATGILLLLAGGAVLLAQKPAVEKVFAFDENRAYLGVTMEEVTAENMATYKLGAEHGVIVRSVEKGSPAEEAGIQEKDVILEYAGTPVLSRMQLARLVQETPAGRKVAVTVSRDGKKTTLTAKIGEREGARWFGDSRKSLVIPGPDSEGVFRFDGPGGKFFRYKVPGGGPFTFYFPKGDEFFAFDTKPRLGVTLQELTDQLGEYLAVPGKKGVLVTAVSKGSPASAADVRAGDVIIKADERSIENPEDLMRSVQRKNPGEKIELKIIRDKKEITLAVELPKDSRKSPGYRL